jgi:hypothetical protein
MLQKPELIARLNFIELDASLVFKQLKELCRKFDSLLPELAGQRLRNPME